MENLDFLYSLFNQYLFQDAKNNIEYIEYYVRTNPALNKNALAKELLDAIKNFSFDSIDIPLFQSIMTKTGKSYQEGQKIIGEIVNWKNYTKDQIEPSKGILKNMITSAICNQANSKFPQNAYEFWKYIKNSEINIATESVSETINFADIDMNTIIAEANTKVYPSSQDWINKCFPCNGYEGGQLVMVSMPPGTGKTLFLMAEAISILTQTDSVVYMLCMGDMRLVDYICRMGAILTGQTFWYASQHLMEMKAALNQAFGRRLIIEIADAGEVNADDFADKMINTVKPDVFMVDYDANFDANLDGEGSSMYLEFGNIYNKMIKITRRLPGCLGFIACQPNKFAMTQEVITKDMISDSSKKVHSCDIIITAGVKVESQNHIGKFKMAKCRRGEEGIEVPYARVSNGRFVPLNYEVYKYISGLEEQQKYTEAQVVELLNASRRTQNLQVASINKRPKVDNPFSK